MFSATFWIAISFILCLVFFGRPVWRNARDYIDNYIREVEEGIRESAKIRDESLAAVTEWRGRLETTQNEVDRILTHAQQVVDKMSHDMTQEKRLWAKKGEDLLQKRIDYARAAATKQLYDIVINYTIMTVRFILLTRPTKHKHLF